VGAAILVSLASQSDRWRVLVLIRGKWTLGPGVVLVRVCWVDILPPGTDAVRILAVFLVSHWSLLSWGVAGWRVCVWNGCSEDSCLVICFVFVFGLYCPGDWGLAGDWRCSGLFICGRVVL